MEEAGGGAAEAAESVLEVWVVAKTEEAEDSEVEVREAPVDSVLTLEEAGVDSIADVCVDGPVREVDVTEGAVFEDGCALGRALADDSAADWPMADPVA